MEVLDIVSDHHFLAFGKAFSKAAKLTKTIIKQARMKIDTQAFIFYIEKVLSDPYPPGLVVLTLLVSSTPWMKCCNLHLMPMLHNHQNMMFASTAAVVNTPELKDLKSLCKKAARKQRTQ